MILIRARAHEVWKGNGQNTSRVSRQSIPIEFRFTEAIYRMQLSGRGKLVKTSFDDGFNMKIRCPLQRKKVTARARCACLRIDIDRFSIYFLRSDDELAGPEKLSVKGARKHDATTAREEAQRTCHGLSQKAVGLGVRATGTTRVNCEGTKANRFKRMGQGHGWLDSGFFSN